MEPLQTAAAYDRIAAWWRDQHATSVYGLAALRRVLVLSPKTGRAIDIGCGSEGRFIRAFREAGFEASGIDASAEMIRLIEERHPWAEFETVDVCDWQPRGTYELITAWDSTFHLPLDQQEPVLATLCQALAPEGVLLFTCGAAAEAGEVSGSFAGEEFEYSTLGIPRYLELLHAHGCLVVHVELDQYPETHTVIIARKLPGTGCRAPALCQSGSLA